MPGAARPRRALAGAVPERARRGDRPRERLPRRRRRLPHEAVRAGRAPRARACAAPARRAGVERDRGHGARPGRARDRQRRSAGRAHADRVPTLGGAGGGARAARPARLADGRWLARGGDRPRQHARRLRRPDPAQAPPGWGARDDRDDTRSRVPARMSFRRRLLLTSLATLAVGLGSLLVAGNVLVARGVRSEASALLRARADAQLGALDVRPGAVSVHDTANDAVLDRQSWVLDGWRLVESPTGASAALDSAAVVLGRRGAVAERDGPGDVRLRARPVYARGSATPSGSVVVALPLAPLERLQREILLGSLVLAALVLLAGGLATRSAIDDALHRVAQMTASADEWGAHDLDRRFGLGPPGDELTGLAATLDGLLARIAASRRHEQRFASEVAHELRTPLAGLRGRAELGLGASGADADAERTEALRAIVADAGRLDGTIGTLLAIARQELDPTVGSVDVGALAAEHEDVHVETARGLPKAEGEPEVVRRALGALVDNARRHARNRVVLELSSGGGRVRLAVRDDGPGVDPELGERVFEAGVRGPGDRADGAGLGLPLSRRLARSCGGDVILGSGAGGCFVLELPAVTA